MRIGIYAEKKSYEHTTNYLLGGVVVN